MKKFILGLAFFSFLSVATYAFEGSEVSFQTEEEFLSLLEPVISHQKEGKIYLKPDVIYIGIDAIWIDCGDLIVPISAVFKDLDGVYVTFPQLIWICPNCRSENIDRDFACRRCSKRRNGKP